MILQILSSFSTLLAAIPGEQVSEANRYTRRLLVFTTPSSSQTTLLDSPTQEARSSSPVGISPPFPTPAIPPGPSPSRLTVLRIQHSLLSPTLSIHFSPHWIRPSFCTDRTSLTVVYCDWRYLWSLSHIVPLSGTAFPPRCYLFPFHPVQLLHNEISVF